MRNRAVRDRYVGRMSRLAVTGDPASMKPDRGIFVGGATELARFRRLLTDALPRVLFMHGLAGAGKSTLIQQFAMAEAPSGAGVVVLDCREIEPTEMGFTHALAEILGSESMDAASGDLEALGRLAGDVVLCLDHYEVFRLLDTWLRQRLVPALPTNVSLLISSREEPHAAWSRLPAGMFEMMRPESLSTEDSLKLLGGMGVTGQDAFSISGFAGGHPLTLVLGALASKERPPSEVRRVTMERLLEEFTEAYLDELDEENRAFLEAAAVTRRMTIPMMEAMFPDRDGMVGFRALSQLPFVHAMSDGLALHTCLQEPIAARLWASSPQRHRDLRRRAWAYLKGQLQSVPHAELWRHTADMIYLLENRAVREAVFPSSAHTYAVEPAVVSDGPEIRSIVTRHEHPPAAPLIEQWWNLDRGTFRVARDGDGRVAGFSIVTSNVEHLELVSDDPVVAVWLEHLRQSRLPAGQEALFLRRWLTWEDGDSPGEAQAALWLDLKRMYMELRPRLRRIYSTTDHPGVYGPALSQLEARQIGSLVEIDGHGYASFCLDFGPSSVDGWLTRVAARELGIEEDGLLDVGRRQLVVDGRRIDLTPKEFDVMTCLNEQAGNVVGRPDLLESIWGYDEPLGSNVVDAVIYTLRKKLGGRAGELETVRGVGYRLARS